MPRGLSPRVRGNLASTVQTTINGRSIPACTGEPAECSGAFPALGSIPACTGEPIKPEPEPEAKAVYPRVYGGTPQPTRCADAPSGLSPRVRGNQAVLVETHVRERSIPACTGEPLPLSGSITIPSVYPRVYGGTGLGFDLGHLGLGLSPRVRGNPPSSAPCHTKPRSIPACTGEPPRFVSRWHGKAVYPRVYGGTLCRQGQEHPGYRSIPACTGEPWGRVGLFNAEEVYPRVYGGTTQASAPFRCRRGLSPRVRGNRPRRRPGPGHRGSIPACTGEPSLPFDHTI